MTRLSALRPGDLLTIVGMDSVALAARLPVDAAPLLSVDLVGATGHMAIIARVLDDLATLALAAWPTWPRPKLVSWGRAAGRLAAAGRPPRFRSIAQETQFAELVSAAGAPILLFPVDFARRDRAAPIIAALDWCRRHGAAVVAMLAEAPAAEPPWDLVLHDALTAEAAPQSLVDRLLVPPQVVRAPGGSATEKRMRVALAADRELAGLFEDEVTIQLGPLGPTPRVDLLWRQGKVVVELDGCEHAFEKYAADRHRDYELLVEGYLVLRLTNAEIALDLARSLDKVRRVVDLRRETV